MNDMISSGLNQLVAGLQPYVAARVRTLRAEDADRIIASFSDPHAILVYMWDHWNDLFRHELSFAERCLVSELREYRNRWAHQRVFSDDDVYRFLDDVERLLNAIQSPAASAAGSLRLKALANLSTRYSQTDATPRKKTFLGAMAICLVCAAAIDFALLNYFFSGLSCIMALLVSVLFYRIGRRLAVREAVITVGPRECPTCARVVYSAQCPYCETQEFSAAELVSRQRDKNAA
ncbi:MAG: hypothetical protein KDA91_00755 [Planctomycetaceae bacterium]|nr:hypothetical protein [Planctomycetaceae bacterium]